MNDKFLNELKQNPKICDHLHIPLQAGSNEILKRMNRKYDLEYFKEKINQIRKIRPHISITTDMIVGHPFETEELFEETLKTAKELQFSKIHAFPYSKRNGTLAASMEQQVSEEAKKNRNRKLIELSNHLEHTYAASFLNQTVMVLIEEIKDNLSIGHTENYLKVCIPQKLTTNQYYEVKLQKIENNILYGTLQNNKKRSIKIENNLL